MIPKAKSKFIKSLQIKKYRKQEQCFVVEGKKSVAELIRSEYEVVSLLATREFLAYQRGQGKNIAEVLEVDVDDLTGLGEFKTNDGALAIARMKPNVPLEPGVNEWVLVVDDIRDPGNLGTINRTADWYGVNKIIASEQTAELYNPKVISATMGSFLRVSLYYTSLPEFLSRSASGIAGAFLDGDDIHHCSFEAGGLLVIGNESRGISEDVARLVTQRITIPKYGRAESLNAGIATAVILDNLRRNQRKV